MLKRILKWSWQATPWALGLSLLALAVPRLVTGIYASDHLYEVADAPARRVAIVFGAGLRRDGTPTAILRDRVETARSCTEPEKWKKS